MQYRLIKLDVDHNNEINDAWTTGETLDLPENPSVQMICDGLKELGDHRMAPDWPVNKVGADWSDDNGDVYVLNEKGRKVYKLEPVRGS